MKRDVQIICENTGKRELIKPGLSLLEVSQAIGVKLAHPILGAMVNNELRELDYCIYSPKTIRFIDITHPAGMRMYQRSLFFLLSKAVRDVVPGGKLRIEHSVSKGFYCEIEGLNESL
ncbi:MAG TPA: nucleoside kinase, partial [Tenuifilaceae bacterium]|nr:nucleoside kinase [Tenuifilaceae bacterium]